MPNTVCYRASQWGLGFHIWWLSHVPPNCHRKPSKDCCGPQSKASRAILVSNTSTQNTFPGPLKHVFGRFWIPIQAETLWILLMFFVVFLIHFEQIPGYHLIWSHNWCVLCQGWTDFFLYKCRCQKGGLQQLPSWEPTNIQRHHTKFSRHSELASGICTSLFYVIFESLLRSCQQSKLYILRYCHWRTN